MPTKKQRKKLSDDIKPDKKYSVQFYLRYKNLSNIMYYRLKYEIRDEPNRKMTIDQWDKLYNKVKF